MRVMQLCLYIHSAKKMRDLQTTSDFSQLFNVVGEVDKIISAGQVSEVNLYFAWVRGNESFLKK